MQFWTRRGLLAATTGVALALTGGFAAAQDKPTFAMI